MLHELPVELRAAIGTALPLADHVRYVTATSDIHRPEYAAALAPRDTITATLLNPTVPPQERRLLCEAVFATRPASELGVHGPAIQRVSGARPAGEHFLQSLRHPEIFSCVVRLGQSDPRIWQMLQAAWTRYPPRDARRLYHNMLPSLDAPRHDDAHRAYAEFETVHAVPSPDFRVEALNRMHDANGPLRESLRGLWTARRIIRDALAAHPPQNVESSAPIALIGLSQYRHSTEAVREYILADREIAHHLRTRTHLDEAFDSRLAQIAKLSADAPYQAHEFRRAQTEFAEKNYQMPSASYTSYLRRLASIADDGTRHAALDEFIAKNRNYVHVRVVIAGIRDPRLRAEAEQRLGA